MSHDAHDRTRRIRWVTALSVGVALTLATLKIIVWWFSGSVSLLASAADSGLDLFASSATFVAVRYAATPPDAEHRFGHGKAEAFASLLQAGLVFASAALVGEEAIRHLIEPQPVLREAWATGVMGVSIVLTATLIAAQSRALRAGDSVAVSADRTHYAADLASNLIALAAIVLAWLGWTVADPLGGLAVTGVLLAGAVSVFRDSSGQLLDREMPVADRRRIIALMTADPRINHVHQLRTRSSGAVVHMQMHADLDPDISLDEAHRVVVAAENRVLEAYPQADILIHPDPRGRAEPHGGAFAEAAEPE